MAGRSIYDDSVPNNICRVCLATDRNMYCMRTHNGLDKAYEALTGLSIKNDDNLPLYLCYECAQRLLNCVQFRTRSLRAHLVLLDVVKRHDRVTSSAVSSVIGNQNFKSNLAVTKNKTDHYDIEFVHVDDVDTDRQVEVIDSTGNDNNGDDVMSDSGPMIETVVKVERDFGEMPSVERDEQNSIDEAPMEVLCVSNLQDDSVQDEDRGNITLEVTVVKNESDGDDVTMLDESISIDETPRDVSCVSNLQDDSVKDDERGNITLEVTVVKNESDGVDLTMLDEPISIDETPRDVLCVSNLQDDIVQDEDRGNITLEVTVVKNESDGDDVTMLDEPISIDETPRDVLCVSNLQDDIVQDEDRGNITLEVTVVKNESDGDDVTMLDEPISIDETPRDVLCVSNLQDDSVQDEDRGNITLEVSVVKNESDGDDFTMLDDQNSADGAYSPLVEHESTSIELKDMSDLKDVKKSDKKSGKTAKRSVKKSISCNVCEKRFVNKDALYKHVLVHTGKKPFNCPICGREFPKNSTLLMHLRVHTGDKPYTCDICGKSFSQKNSVATHLQTHSGEKPFTCDICQRTFAMKCNLRKHIRNHAGDKPISCEHCRKKFFFNSQLVVHLRAHSGEKPFSCKDCAKSYSRASDLVIHMKTHKGERPFACHICEKPLPNKTSLRNHLRTHSNEKPHTCNVCQKSFREKSNLHQHIKIHSEEKPYSCNICNKAYSGKASLRKHIIIHSTVKPFSCNICNRGFNKNANLEKHIISKHSKKNPSSSKKLKPYSCNVCNRRFNDNANLEKHIITKHSKNNPSPPKKRKPIQEKLYSCDICMEAYSAKTTLIKHLTLHYGMFLQPPEQSQ